MLSAKALKAGLNFGVEVSTTYGKGAIRNSQCAPDGDDEANPCQCGLIYKDHLMRAQGTEIRKGPPESQCPIEEDHFDITVPIKNTGRPITDWQQCRGPESKCKAYESYSPCLDPNHAMDDRGFTPRLVRCARHSI